MKLASIYFFLFLLNQTCLSQTLKIENIKKQVALARNNEEKLLSLVKINGEYQSVNRDTLNLFVVEMKKLISKSKNPQINLLVQLAEANNYFRWGWTDSSRIVIEAALKKVDRKNPTFKEIYLNFLRLKAMNLGAKSLFKESLANHMITAKEAEVFKDSVMMGLSYNSIGSVNMALSDRILAKSWINKAIKICSNPLKFEQVLAPSYLNLANELILENKLDSAQYLLNKALQISRKIENLNYVSTALRLQSNIDIQKENWALAEKALLEMFAIRKKLNGINSSLIDDNIQLAEFYAKTKQYQKAINICKENLKKGDLYLTNKNGSQNYNNIVTNQIEYLNLLAKYYKLSGQLPEYQATLEQFIAVKDSFTTANSMAEIAELQTKYEVEKKEKTIAQQNLDLTLKNYWLYGSSLFTILLAIIGGLLFRNFRRKQTYKLKNALEEEKQIGARQILVAEEQERKRIASDLHDNIGAYATAIKADVEKITDLGNDKNNNSLQNLQQHSQEIIDSLRDTIWVLNKDEITVTNISDRIKNYINKLQPSYENIQINVNELIENNQKISSQIALNIFRIVQEAIHNALKHSESNNIIVNIICNEKLSFEIVDDGKGIGNTQNLEGNGLKNMAARAKEIGMTFLVENAGNGSKVYIETL